MFEKKQNQGMDLCLILINPRVLYENNCIFFPHNAATASYRNVPIANLQGRRHLKYYLLKKLLIKNLVENPNLFGVVQVYWIAKQHWIKQKYSALEMIEPRYIFSTLCFSL